MKYKKGDSIDKWDWLKAFLRHDIESNKNRLMHMYRMGTESTNYGCYDYVVANAQDCQELYYYNEKMKEILEMMEEIEDEI